MTQVPVRSAGPGLRRTALRIIGWLCIATGAVMLLFLVWLLWFTGFGTADVQKELLEEFEGFAQVDVDPAAPGPDSELVDDDPSLDGIDPETGAVDVGYGIAVLEFERPGTDDRPVHDDPLVVVQGASDNQLRLGPGHIANTAMPGEEGNVVVVGHRTTYGAPFYNIDQILPGDLVHLTNRAGDRFTYRVMQGDSDVGEGVRIIRADELWVVGPQPLGEPGKFLTLISCHPRFSSAQRIIVFAELVE